MREWRSVPMYAIATPKSVVNCTERELLSVYLGKGVVPFASEGAKRTNVTSLDLSKYQAVDYGDLVLNNQQAWRGSVGVSKHSGIVSPAYIVLALAKSITADFANYLFQNRTMVDQYVICSKGVGSIQRNIYWVYLKRVQVPLPHRTEQNQIVRYLDWKVSGINRLINVKKTQIGLLQEQNRVIINSAVMSGGEGWTSIPLKNLLSPVSERNRPDLPLLSVVREQGIILRNIEDKEENHNFIPDDLSNYKVVRQGQFVMNKMKAWQGSYGVSLYDGIVSPAYYVFNLNCEYKEFFHRAIRCQFYVDKFAQFSVGIRTGQWDFPLEKIREIEIFLPPLEVQAAIVAEIDAKIAAINRLIDKITAEITLLHEYRTRLISDVVTGKMDVRDVEVPEFETVEEATGEDDVSEDEEEPIDTEEK